MRPRLLAVVLVLSSFPVQADEGMWTFDNPPLARLKEVYGFVPTESWLEKVRLASVRFNDGGSGAFVSPDGLMLTNHHVGAACIQNLSTPEHDYLQDGFLAASRDREPGCPGYEVNVLLGAEDVTSRIQGGVSSAMSDKEAGDARKAAVAKVETECASTTGLRCDIVTLYQGSEYHLYRYRKYTDVRLVFAPERQAAFFGGDSDNFTFPRHDLDVAFFRAYEDGKPVKPAAFLPWSRTGVKEGDLVFVSGHPGSTSRLELMVELMSARDVQLPSTLKAIRRRIGLLRSYAARGPEQDRRTRSTLLSYTNADKALSGGYAALQDAKAMARKAADEKALRDKVAADPVLAKEVGDAWKVVADARKRADARQEEERLVGFSGSRLLAMAGQIVRYAAETRKPNEVRLAEYVDSNLESLRNRLFSAAPIFADLEDATLADQLADARETLGRDHPFVKAALGSKTPAEVAREVVGGTALQDVEARKALVEGGPAAVEGSADPMIALARRIDPLARDVRKFDEDEVRAPLTRAGDRIARARWKIYGKTVHPDATFTLRLSYGVVKGYPAEGTEVPAFTTFHGLYDRSAAFAGREPWNLSRRFAERKAALDLATPFNFVSTADIIGGNSGSPTLNRDGEFVGIIFDGNIESLALDYFYTDERSRALSVDARAIVEALRKVYDAAGLADELTGASAR